MNNHTLHLHLTQWLELPGDLADPTYFMTPYPAPLDTKFHALSTLYLEIDPPQQQYLTNFFAHNITPTPSSETTNTRFDNAIIYMRRAARCIMSAPDESLLRLGLAAAAWTEGQVDNHDLLISLAFLYHAATRAGINPAPHFEVIAAIAGSQGQTTLRAFLHCDVKTVRRMVRHYEGTC